jgi:tRNA threonylcarbamoyladenosine biosynthesis protein TsaB
MRILALESSARAASVAVVEDGAFLAQYYQAKGLTHSRTLMVMAENILRDMEFTLADMTPSPWRRGRAPLRGFGSACPRQKDLPGAEI